ncbi:MAG: transcriptional regulator [Candidatus Palauibacterales bacterium]|nr:transcriptional regulator [Candidatus Palauibacterales bacterium]MDP2483504.1 transcriptional regulator [Candidatus Palauibacterales bacterium]
MADKRRAAARAVDSEETMNGQSETPSGAAASLVAHGGPLELDGLIHERMRLGIVSALSVNDRLAFTELRQVLDTTDGNLSAHARKLEDAGYIECRKSFAGRVPRTDYALTALGRARLADYLAHMEALIRMTRQG